MKKLFILPLLFIAACVTTSFDAQVAAYDAYALVQQGDPRTPEEILESFNLSPADAKRALELYQSINHAGR